MYAKRFHSPAGYGWTGRGNFRSRRRIRPLASLVCAAVFLICLGGCSPSDVEGLPPSSDAAPAPDAGLSGIGIAVSEDGRVTVSPTGTGPVLGTRQSGVAWGQTEDASLPSPAETRITGYPENLSDEMVRQLDSLPDDQPVRARFYFYDTDTMERTEREGYTLLALDRALCAEGAIEEAQRPQLEALRFALVADLSEALYQTFTAAYSLPGLAHDNFSHGACGGMTATLTKAQVIALARRDSRLYFDTVGLYERPKGYSDRLSDELALRLEVSDALDTVFPVRLFAPSLEQLTPEQRSNSWQDPVLTAGGVSFYSRELWNYSSEDLYSDRTVYGRVDGNKKYLQEDIRPVGYAADRAAAEDTEGLDPAYAAGLATDASRRPVLLVNLTRDELLAAAESGEVVFVDDNSAWSPVQLS